MVDRNSRRASALVAALLPLLLACGGGAPPTTGPAASPPASASAPSAAVSLLPVIPTATTLIEVPPTSPASVAASQAAAGPDYMGDWGGLRLAGSVKWCGSVAHPYWGADIVSSSGDRGFLAYDIPTGSTDPVQAEVVTPFVVPEFTTAAKGTGQFVPGSPPHFVIVNGEGTWDMPLRTGSFCASSE